MVWRRRHICVRMWWWCSRRFSSSSGCVVYLRVLASMKSLSLVYNKKSWIKDAPRESVKKNIIYMRRSVSYQKLAASVIPIMLAIRDTNNMLSAVEDYELTKQWTSIQWATRVISFAALFVALIWIWGKHCSTLLIQYAVSSWFLIINLHFQLLSN